MRFIWTTDIHWDRVSNSGRREFFADVAELQEEQPAAGLIISGDIGEAPSLISYLVEIHAQLRLPIYFVLGNHDFYQSDLAAVRTQVRNLVDARREFHWLSELPAVSLTPQSALVGHEGWADARLGEFHAARQWPQDFLQIHDFQNISREAIQHRLNSLGDEAAAELRPKLLAALSHHRQVYCVTHVPPFRETCVDRIGKVHAERLPFYTCHAVGEMLLEVCAQHPEQQITVLCGHTHERCDVAIRPNLRVRVKAAGYGRTFTPDVIEFP